MSRSSVAKLFVAYLLLLFGLTLVWFTHANASRNFVPFQTIEHDIRQGGWEFQVNFVGNLAATLPIGWFLPALLGQRCRWWKVAGVAGGLSLLIETLQGISGRRVADVDDVILNTLGGLIGYGVWIVVVAGQARFRGLSAGEVVE